MIEIQKQIKYWINGAEDDLLTAELLIQERRILHGLFFCHLVIEKGINPHCAERPNLGLKKNIFAKFQTILG